MSADAWPAGVGRVVLPEIDSTNAEAARLAEAGAGPTWILAGFQTLGRGRRGRAWVSPRGNFHATLMDRPAGPPAQVALLSFAAGLALREALAALAPGVYTLKWPNDVLLNGGKVAGILLESAGAGGRVSYLAAGMGVNLIAAPDPADLEPGARRPVSVLAETGMRVEPAALLDRLAPAYACLSARLAADGFRPLRDAWLAHAAGLGAPLTARTGTETATGVFETIDATGALVLLTPDGRRSIPAGDVYF